MNEVKLSRRAMCQLACASTVHSLIASDVALGRQLDPETAGAVIGEPRGELVGMRVLAQGGNAIDAIVAAALTAAVSAPSSTGIGGYGMCAVIAVESGRRIVAIDGNSTAPMALRAETFLRGADGRILNRANETGWLSAGVPGILAGLQLALDQFGTRPFGELVQPAIVLARDGFLWTKGLASAVQARSMSLKRDEGSRKLFFPQDKPVAEGSLFKNQDLAEMLSALATANSVEPFYRGDIASSIAASFQKSGGLMTSQDLAAYRARVVEPLKLELGECTVYTAPLTAGGLSVLQMLQAMQALGWEKLPQEQRALARVEAMRLAWRDRLTSLGDPDFGDIPMTRLLSADYARESAERINAALKSGKLLSHHVAPRPQSGTINLCSADRFGNFVALTLTHGEAFGACVTVDGLGLTLGHGMSRFDTQLHHPNATGPGKRPLHNMVPTVVTRAGKPVLAVGGTGGRKIPNALFEVLTQYIVLDRTLALSVAAPRLHTEGDATVTVEKTWSANEADAMRTFGYNVSIAGSATMSAVALESDTLVKAKR